jgi:peptidyl-prolyl cis-trans isomerase SurA
MMGRHERLAITCVMVMSGLVGCKSAPPPKLPPIPADAGSVLLPPGVASRPPNDQAVVERVVAVVNEDVITMSELQEAVALAVRENKESVPTDLTERERYVQKVLARMVDHRLEVQEAKRDKVEVTEEELAAVMDDFVKRNGGDRAAIEDQLRAQGLSWNVIKRDMRDSMLAQRVRARRVGRKAAVTSDEVEAYVTENRSKFEADLKIHPRHIAVLAQPPDSPAAWEKAKGEVDQIVLKLRSGADFAELARQYSQDGTADSGGDLGWLTRGELAAVFEEPILKLRKGEVTAPIKSENGYHLFQLEEREELTPEMLNQFRQQARDILVQKKAQERLEEWLQGLRQRALIAERL